MAELTATGAAERFGIARKGRIAPAHDADLALIDPHAPYRLAAEDLRYRHRISPYVGRTLPGARDADAAARSRPGAGRRAAADTYDPLMLTVTAGPFSFKGVLETEKAPKTVAAFERLLPFHSKIIHVRWSGESAWIPLGDFDIGLDGKPENATRHPAPGQVLWYPGGLSETEILFPYGGTMFA